MSDRNAQRTDKFYKLEARKAGSKNWRNGIIGGDALRICSELELKLDVLLFLYPLYSSAHPEISKETIAGEIIDNTI